jgi:hypothetical protein
MYAGICYGIAEYHPDRRTNASQLSDQAVRINARRNSAMNANLFSRLFDDLDDADRLAIETPGGRRITYGDLIA